jgi:hypothetical protein
VATTKKSPFAIRAIAQQQRETRENLSMGNPTCPMCGKSHSPGQACQIERKPTQQEKAFDRRYEKLNKEQTPKKPNPFDGYKKI